MTAPLTAAWRRRLPWGVVAGAVLTALLRAITAPPPTDAPSRRLTAEQRDALSTETKDLEGEWRHGGAMLYPGDRWSADDDFHNQEGRWARGVAGTFHVPVADVLRAIDEGLHAARRHGTPRRSTASPCKPRPFYD